MPTKSEKIKPTSLLEIAACEFQALSKQPGFDFDKFNRWDAGSFIERHGISLDDLNQIMRQARPKTNADRFEWLQSVNQRHDLGSRTLRVAVALFSFVGAHGYAWPSQKGLAKRAGYDPKDERNIRRSLAALTAIGAIRIIRAANLPEDLAAVALAASTEGGSGRSYRGSAYALVPFEQWQENSVTGSSQPYDNRVVVAPYNHQFKPQSLREDFSNQYNSSVNVETVLDVSNSHDDPELDSVSGGLS